MFIDRRVHPISTPFGGAEFNESFPPIPLLRTEPQGYCSTIYKHVTPNGVSPTIISEQLTTNH